MYLCKYFFWLKERKVFVLFILWIVKIVQSIATSHSLWLPFSLVASYDTPRRCQGYSKVLLATPLPAGQFYLEKQLSPNSV